MFQNGNKPFAPSRWPFFYGYIILACSAVGFLFSAPGQTIGVSVFTDSLINHAELSRLAVSIAYGVGTVGSALVIGRVGGLVDRLGTRFVSFWVAVALGGALLYMSQVDRFGLIISRILPISTETARFSALVLGFFVIRFLGQGMLSLTSRTMLMNWFDNLRGRVNSILGVFVALTLSGAPLVFETLLQSFGWRLAWILIGVFLGTLGAAAIAVFYRDNPESCQLLPDGRKRHPDEDEMARNPLSGWTMHEARRSLGFWVFNLGGGLYALLGTAVAFHVVSIFGEAGIARQKAVSVFLPAAVIAVGVSLVAGWLSDHPGLRYRLNWFLAVFLGGNLAVAIGILLLHTGPGYWIIAAGQGVASGLMPTITAVVWARYFGRAHLGAITGYNLSYVVLGSAFGPPLFAGFYHLFGNYSGGAVAILVASVIFLLLTPFADYARMTRKDA